MANKATKELLNELKSPTRMTVEESADALRDFLPKLHAMVHQARLIIERTQQAELDEDDRVLRVAFEGLYQKVGAVEHLGAETDRNLRRLIHTLREIGDVVNGVQHDGDEERQPGIRQKAEAAGYKNVWPKEK